VDLPLHPGRDAERDALALSPWRFRNADTGDVSAIEAMPRLLVSSPDAAIDSAIDGIGATRVLEHDAAAAIKAGSPNVSRKRSRSIRSQCTSFIFPETSCRSGFADFSISRCPGCGRVCPALERLVDGPLRKLGTSLLISGRAS